MKDLALDRRMHVLASITFVVLIWSLLIVPGGAPWTGIVCLAAQAVLLLVAATLLSRAPSHSMMQVLPGVEVAPKAIADSRGLRHCSARHARAVTTECAERRK